MNWTNREKVAVASVLLDIMNADGRIDDGEILYFDQLQRAIGISNDQIREAKSLSVSLSIDTIKNMDFDKKKAVGVMLTEMVSADGDVDSEEVRVWGILVALCGIPKLSD